MIIRKRIDLQGIVQGVGFRPYVFRLATESNLAGVISNTSSGVTRRGRGLVRGGRRVRLAFAAGTAAACTHHSARCHGHSVPWRIGFSNSAEPQRRACADADLGGRGHVRRLPWRNVRPGGQAIWLPFHQLHQLRPALHDCPRHPLRPALYLDGGVPDVRGVSKGV